MAKAPLSSLTDEVIRSEEAINSKHGKPVAKLSGLAPPNRRELGFHPITFGSDLLEPATDEVVEAFNNP